MISAQSIGKNSVHLFGSSIIQKILTFAYFIIIARTYGPLDQGRYSAALAFATLFGVLIDLGLSSALTRETARTPEKASTFAGQMFLLRFVASAIVYAALVGSAALFGFPEEVRILIAVAGLATIVDVLSTSCWGIMRGFQNMRYEAIGGVIAIGVMMAIGCLAVFFHLHVQVLVYAVLAGSSANFLYVLTILMRKGKIHISFTPDWVLLRTLILLTLPFAGAAIFSRIFTFADTALVARLAGEQHAGYYSAANKLILALNTIPAAFASSMYPAMSASFATQRTRLSHLFERATFLLLLLGFPLAIGIGVLAPQIVETFYGNQYVPSILTLQILTPALFFGFLTFPLGSLLAASNRQHINTLSYGIAAGISLALNIFLIPIFQSVGSAWAASATYAVIFIISTYFAWSDIRQVWGKILASVWKIGVSAGVMGLFVGAIQSHVTIGMSILVAVCIYVLMLCATRCITADEVRRLTHEIRGDVL